MKALVRSVRAPGPGTRIQFVTPVWAVLALCLSAFPHSEAQGQANPVVAVTGGKVEGRLLPTAQAVFKGVPYAQPPVGDLRWREPQPVKAWTGVRQADDFGNACAQTDSGWNKVAASRSSEDCLYLNIWTPDWPAKTKHPVMLWLHGGGNSGGSAMGAGSIEPPFDGASLAHHGVVLVTINYRLGVFGFMGHPELTAESPHHASGGYGLLDQIAALRWVQENIAKFGGDPGNVTLFGQSAGAQDTTLIVASPVAKGLFQKAIAESGSPMISDKRLQTQAQMEELGVILAKSLNAPATGSIAYLRGLSTAQVLAAMPEFRKGTNEEHLILDAGIDGYVVPGFTPAVYRAGKEMAIPMIFGSNSRDNPGMGRGPGPNATPEQVQADLKKRIDSTYGKYPDLEQRAEKVYGLTGDTANISNYPPYGDVVLQYGTDHSMRCESVSEAGWHSAIAPTYQYEFTAGNAAHPPVHSAELDFVFGYLRDQAADPTLNKLSEQMQEYWTNFAKKGDPNGPGLPVWPKYAVATRPYIDFSNQGPIAKADLRGPACAVYVERLTRDIEARTGSKTGANQ